MMFLSRAESSYLHQHLSVVRHVIHAALQDHPDVTTFSTGTEPNRRIVVAYSRGKAVSTDDE